MLNKLIAEATEIDFKVALEVKKPKSWLKSVNETENLPGYAEEMRPEFHSSGTDSRVVLNHVNCNLVTGTQVGDQDSDQDKGQQSAIMHGTIQDTMHDTVHDGSLALPGICGRFLWARFLCCAKT